MNTLENNARPPIPPFDVDSAAKKVRVAEDAWNTRDPERVSLAYTISQRVAESLGVPHRPRLNRPIPHPQVEQGVGLSSSRNSGPFAAIGLRFDSPTSGTTTQATGFAPTAMRTGSSTSTASCNAASPASTIFPLGRATESITGHSGDVRTIIRDSPRLIYELSSTVRGCRRS